MSNIPYIIETQAEEPNRRSNIRDWVSGVANHRDSVRRMLANNLF